jgi:hypothetical protein
MKRSLSIATAAAAWSGGLPLQLGVCGNSGVRLGKHNLFPPANNLGVNGRKTTLKLG